MNPTKKVVYANNVPTNGSKFGKNNLLSTSGVTTPKRKKSYHSIVVPIALANAIVPIDVPKPPDCVLTLHSFPPVFAAQIYSVGSCKILPCLRRACWMSSKTCAQSGKARNQLAVAAGETVLVELDVVFHAGADVPAEFEAPID